jgi:hypothetical protein
VEKAERDAIMRQGVVLPETPRDRRERAALEEDLRSIRSRGRPLPLRLRNFRPRADSYLAGARGPLHYMLRLHDIERRLEDHEEALREAWRELADDCAADARDFRRRWLDAARAFRLHGRERPDRAPQPLVPIESQLPMDPCSGEFALVNGRDYRLEPLDESWIIERFPPELEAVLPALRTAAT